MKNRLLSLDVFRGMTVFFMIIVNSTGNWSKTYAPLLHAKWHGFTPTDFVFPAFLIAVGAAMAIVLPKWKATLKPVEAYRKILLRTIIIFVLGFLMYWFPFCSWQTDGSLQLRPIADTRIMGVLQRIALAYGLSAFLLYSFSLSSVIKMTMAILVGYWFILIGFGDLTLEGNVGRLIDLAIFGEAHLYKGEGIAFDPEGLLSTLPCIGNVVAGYMTVFYLRSDDSYARKFKILLVGAALIGLAGLWHYGFPINKKLWTSSYVLLTSGIGISMLMALHYLLDLSKESKYWASIFTPMGKNPLIIYIVSQLGLSLLYWWPSTEHGNSYNAVYQQGFKWAGEYLGSFLFAFSWTMVCWSIALLMDKKKWYVRV